MSKQINYHIANRDSDLPHAHLHSRAQSPWEVVAFNSSKSRREDLPVTDLHPYL